MTWKEKIDQMAALLEKIPQPQNFEIEKGVYQPYFILELRPANWEILPYAEYTRLDGQPGKEIKLNLQVLESQKVNITQEELNILAYIYSFSNYDTRRLFTFGQPVGFLLEWLRESQIRVRISDSRELQKTDFSEETGELSLGLYQHGERYVLQPAIVFPEESVVIDDRVFVLTANPVHLYFKNTIYRVNSNLPPFFWINFFRIQQQVEIPVEELKEFINSFVPKILPAIDWKSLEGHLKLYELPLSSTRLYLSERAGQLHIEVRFVYQHSEFPAHPPAEKSLATQGKYLFVVRREQEKEAKLRRILHENGLFYLQHRWQLDPQYKVLDWLRTKISELAGYGIEFFGEERLHRYRLRRETPRISLRITTGIDWLNLDYQIQLNGNTVTVANLAEQIRQNKNYIKLTDGSNIYLSDDAIRRFREFFSIIDSSDLKGSQKFQFAAFPLVQELVQIADLTEADAGYDTWAENYRNFKEIKKVAIPKSFSGRLRDYQRAGLDWLDFLYNMRLGGILADDMGLGKTVQVIAFIERLRITKKLQAPVMIVVPVTVLFNWQNEINRFAPKLKVLQYKGQKSDREAMQKRLEKFHVVLLSYGILLQDLESLQAAPWQYIVLDESQKIKNPTTKTYRAVTALDIPHRLCLTGTPVENSLGDLWAQLNFLNPGMLGTLTQFEARFAGNDEDSDKKQELLRQIIYPFILRRTKDQVVRELPDRTDIVQLVEMTELQQKVYREKLEFYRERIFDQVEKDGLAKSRFKILEALTALRQIACHPAILNPDIQLSESGKVELLDEMLEAILEEGHKVLIFSQYVRFLKLIQALVLQKGWTFEYLDGSIRNREERINNFQQNPNVKIFLISLKTGGLGLNLTAADYVIHLDPWWNPAVEQQATDRAHRIGQENRVFVYKYIMKDTVEEKVLQLQQQKRDLFDSVIISDKGLIKQLTEDDLENIFRPLD